MQTLGQKIRECRESAQLSQPQLAELVGVSKGIVSFWENDLNEPKASSIIKLCKVFDISADELLGLQ